MDFAEARRRMADGQLRPNKVSDPRILAAMRTLPREVFLPVALRSRAYVDEDVALGGGRVLMEPMILARLIQALEPRPADRALVVCAGAGYGAAVLAEMGARVTALEPEPALRALAEAALARCTSPGAVKLVDGAAERGFAAGAPYDVILIEGAAPAVPEAVAAQLAEGGRLAAVLANGRSGGLAVLGRRVAGGFSVTALFDATTPVLPPLAPAPSFVF